MSAPDKQALLARNAALRAEIAQELAGIRAEIDPALRWVDQARSATDWARGHLPLLGLLAGLGGVLLLRRRRPTAAVAAAPSLLARLPRLIDGARTALTLGSLAWAMVQERRERRDAPHSPR
jgi:hypothetical protein